MTDDAASHGAIAALVGWSLTLTEPLLSLRRRGRLEDGLARTHSQNPATVHLFLAGVCSDLIGTLPDRDPWLSLSAKFGDVAVGKQPPESDGATLNGQPFGTWRDAEDLIPLVYASPFDDPGLAALAGDELSPAAAAFLASAGYGWEAAKRVLDEVWQLGPPMDDSIAAVTDILTRESWKRGAALHYTRESATQAIRWALHRRRGYVGADDPWPNESAFRWAYRVTRSSRSVPWKNEDVLRSIEASKIRQAAPQDRPVEDDAF